MITLNFTPQNQNYDMQHFNPLQHMYDNKEINQNTSQKSARKSIRQTDLACKDHQILVMVAMNKMLDYCIHHTLRSQQKKYCMSMGLRWNMRP